MKPGTPQHRDLFCRTFIETHAPFEPENLPWPELDALHLERLRKFPLWSYARSIEQHAGLMVSAFAQTLDDPMIREAVALQGLEETRHGLLMTHVLERYGIDAPQLPISDPSVREDDFLIFGFGECTDSFIGFGAFALARQKQIFPESLMSIFNGVLWEEARHIVFFINWWRYEQARAGRDGFFQRTATSMKYHLRAAIGTSQNAGSAQLPDLSGEEIKAIVGGVTPIMFLEAALAENRRHMAKFDKRLIRPRLMPTVATLALLGLRMLPPRKDAAASAVVPVQRGDALRSRNAA